MFNTTTLSNRSFKQVIPWSLLVITVFSALLFYYESNREERIQRTVYQSIEQATSYSANMLRADINVYKSYIRLLSELPSIESHLDIDPHADNDRQNRIREDISSTFRALLKQENNIRQARLILGDGNEYVRVDRGRSEIKTTPLNLLQSKANRSYFKKGMLLSKNEIYISEISPNYEHGEIDLPLWPTYRVIKALRNNNNENAGILVLNIDTSSSLDKLNNSPSTTLSTFEFDYFLVNQNGFYVAAPDKSLLFGDDLGNKNMNWFTHTGNRVPLSNTKNFQTLFHEKQYLFSSKELSFSNNERSNRYYLIAALPIEKIELLIEAQRKDLFLSVFGFGLIIALIIYLSLKHIRNLEDLYLNQSRFKAIISNSSDAILSINLEGIIQSWNYASSLLFGLKEEQAIGHSLFNLVDENDEFNEVCLKSILHSNSNRRIEVALNNQSQKQRTLLLTLCPIQKKDGNNESIALIIRDITFQKENQHKLEIANQNLDAEVKKRTKQLETEKQKAIKANETKSMFVANISHEIRTPLNAINGLLALALDKTNTEKQDDYLNMAQDSAHTLNALINDLLDLSKIESGKLELSPSQTNLTQLLESIVSTTFVLIKAKNIELILDTSKLAVNSLMIDENRLKQVLTNLLSNAIKFTHDGTVILTASTYFSPDQTNNIECEFQIHDTGMGIPKDQQAKLFKPFIQASSGISNKFGGTGLGLSISKQLCEMMGGTITLESQSGEGSTFTAKLIACKSDNSLTSDANNYIDNAENQNVAIFIKSNPLRRACRNILNSWKVSVSLINNSNELKQVIHSNTLNGLILDSELHTSTLESDLNRHNLSALYLCQDNELVSKVPENRLLHKPILPSSIARQLFGDSIVGKLPEKPAAESQASKTETLVRQKIFVVDDNEINQIVAQGILAAINVDIDTASDGEDIIKKLKQLDQSSVLPVILMDCQMPIMNGYEATRLIREGKVGEWLKSVPIIALTADAMDQNIEECKRAGMDDFLGKPFDPESLKEKVLSWSNKKAF